MDGSGGLKMKIKRKVTGKTADIKHHEIVKDSSKASANAANAASQNSTSAQNGVERGPSSMDTSTSNGAETRQLAAKSAKNDAATNETAASDPYNFEEEDRVAPVNKKMKMEKRSLGVETCSQATITDPDCLGPCEPGTSVVLEGIVWHEALNGVLVVNITWRGKTYVGTLIDATKHDFAPPRLQCDSPTSDLDSRTPAKGGRGKRGRGGQGTTPAETDRKLRVLGKTRARTANNVPTSPAKGGDANSLKRKFQPADLAAESAQAKRNRQGSGPAPTAGTQPTTPSGGSSNSSATADSTSAADNGERMHECPEPNCSKKYRHLNGLRYHQSHSHTTQLAKELRVPSPATQQQQQQARSENSSSSSKPNKKNKNKNKSKKQEQSKPVCVKQEPKSPTATSPKKEPVDSKAKVKVKEEPVKQEPVQPATHVSYQISGPQVQQPLNCVVVPPASPANHQGHVVTGTTLAQVPVGTANEKRTPSKKPAEVKVEKGDVKKSAAGKTPVTSGTPTQPSSRPLTAQGAGATTASSPSSGNAAAGLKPIQPKPQHAAGGVAMAAGGGDNAQVLDNMRQDKKKKKNKKDRKEKESPSNKNETSVIKSIASPPKGEAAADKSQVRAQDLSFRATPAGGNGGKTESIESTSAASPAYSDISDDAEAPTPQPEGETPGKRGGGEAKAAAGERSRPKSPNGGQYGAFHYHQYYNQQHGQAMASPQAKPDAAGDKGDAGERNTATPTSRAAAARQDGGQAKPMSTRQQAEMSRFGYTLTPMGYALDPQYHNYLLQNEPGYKAQYERYLEDRRRQEGKDRPLSREGATGGQLSPPGPPGAPGAPTHLPPHNLPQSPQGFPHGMLRPGGHPDDQQGGKGAAMDNKDALKEKMEQNHQIMLESAELKNQMEHKHNEDLRKFYMFQQHQNQGKDSPGERKAPGGGPDKVDRPSRSGTPDSGRSRDSNEHRNKDGRRSVEVSTPKVTPKAAEGKQSIPGGGQPPPQQPGLPGYSQYFGGPPTFQFGPPPGMPLDPMHPMFRAMNPMAYGLAAPNFHHAAAAAQMRFLHSPGASPVERKDGLLSPKSKPPAEGAAPKGPMDMRVYQNSQPHKIHELAKESAEAARSSPPAAKPTTGAQEGRDGSPVHRHMHLGHHGTHVTAAPPSTAGQPAYMMDQFGR